MLVSTTSPSKTGPLSSLSRRIPLRQRKAKAAQLSLVKDHFHTHYSPNPHHPRNTRGFFLPATSPSTQPPSPRRRMICRFRVRPTGAQETSGISRDSSHRGEGRFVVFEFAPTGRGTVATGEGRTATGTRGKGPSFPSSPQRGERNAQNLPCIRPNGAEEESSFPSFAPTGWATVPCPVMKRRPWTHEELVKVLALYCVKSHSARCTCGIRPCVESVRCLRRFPQRKKCFFERLIDSTFGLRQNEFLIDVKKIRAQSMKQMQEMA